MALACVAFVLVGLAFHVGIGTPSAFGIQQISPSAAGPAKDMAGAKGVMLHPLLLFCAGGSADSLVGKAFCAWMCPVPWLQSFSVEEKEFESDERFQKQAEPFVLRLPWRNNVRQSAGAGGRQARRRAA